MGGRSSQKHLHRIICVLAFAFIMLRTVFALLWDVTIAGAKNNCSPYADKVIFQNGINAIGQANCGPDDKYTTVGLKSNSFIILDMGAGNEITNQPGTDIIYYSKLNADGWLAPVEISVSSLYADGDSGDFIVLFIWEGGPSEKNIEIDLSDVDAEISYRFVRIRPWHSDVQPSEENLVYVDAVENAHPSHIPTPIPTEIPTVESTSTPVPSEIPIPVATDTPINILTETYTSIVLPTQTETVNQTPATTVTFTTNALTTTYTPSKTSVPTATPTPTNTGTQRPTQITEATKTPTKTNTPTITQIPTLISTRTSAPTFISTATFAATKTLTATPTQTRIPTTTSISTSTFTPTNTLTATYTSIPTLTLTNALTPTMTRTTTATFTLRVTFTSTNTPSATYTASRTSTPTITSTPIATGTRKPRPTKTPTKTPFPYASGTPRNTSTPSATETLTVVQRTSKIPIATFIKPSTPLKTPIELPITPTITLNWIPTAAFTPSGTASQPITQPVTVTPTYIVGEPKTSGIINWTDILNNILAAVLLSTFGFLFIKVLLPWFVRRFPEVRKLLNQLKKFTALELDPASEIQVIPVPNELSNGTPQSQKTNHLTLPIELLYWILFIILCLVVPFLIIIGVIFCLFRLLLQSSKK